MRVSDKNGISFAGSETLQMPIAATDFCLSRAERMWDVICAIWDLLRCTEICKSPMIEFSGARGICKHIQRPVFFSPPQTSLLGSGICFLRARRLGRGAWFVGCSCGTPCPHGLRPMGCKICCCCEHGRLRGQCKECGGSSSCCEHRRQRYYCNCKECSGSSFSASTGGSAASARSVAAAASASTGARATTATVECGGSSIASTGGCAPPA